MTIDELEALFEKHSETIGTLSKPTASPNVEFYGRADLSAFMLLNRLVPEGGDIVAGAEHDKIWLGVNLEKLAAVATEADVENLVAWGVFIDEDSLAMFA